MGPVPNPTAQISFTSKASVHPGRVASAVVQLVAVGPAGQGQNRNCSATGFLVNAEGYILTNAHVSKTLRECLPKNPEARIVAKFTRASAVESKAPPRVGGIAPAVACELVGLDEVHDLAVMKTEPPLLPGDSPYGPAQGEVGSSPYVRLDAVDHGPGAPVRVTGHPTFAWEAVTEFGHVLGRKNLWLSGRRALPTEVLILDLRLHPGNSGSPVYLDNGGVVGVVEGQNPQNARQSVAVPIGYAIELLDRLNVKWYAQ